MKDPKLSNLSYPGALLPLLSAKPRPPLDCPQLLLLPRPRLAPGLPLAPALGNAPTWSSPWSPWSPVNATSLVSGAWWNSFLELSSMSALLRRIRTGSLTCLIKGLWKVLKAFMVKSTFSPLCSSVQCFHSGLSSRSFLRFSWCSSPLQYGFLPVSPS